VRVQGTLERGGARSREVCALKRGGAHSGEVCALEQGEAHSREVCALERGGAHSREVWPRARRSLLEGIFEWAALVGHRGHRGVGHAPCV
jgi:hypothetical protein